MITHSDEGPDFDPEDPLTVLLRPPVEYLGAPPGHYEAIRRGAARRRVLRAAAGVGATCAVAFLVALPFRMSASDGPAPPSVPLAPPPATSAPSTAPPVSAAPSPRPSSSPAESASPEPTGTDTGKSTGTRPGAGPSAVPTRVSSTPSTSQPAADRTGGF